MRRLYQNNSHPPNVIDPTKNVEALVAALEKKLQELIEADRRYRDDMREAETRRLDQLAEQRDKYQIRIDDLIERSNQKAVDILARQFDKFEASTSTSLIDLQQKSWATQGEAKRGGAVWGIASVCISVGISAITLAILIFGKS